MNKQIFLNLPVADLPKSTAFFEVLGYSLNPEFTGETSSWAELMGSNFARCTREGRDGGAGLSGAADSSTLLCITRFCIALLVLFGKVARVKTASAKQWIPLIINVAIMALCLLVPARRLGWTNAWALIALSSLSGVAASRVISHDAGLSAERRNMRAGKRWDKPIVAFTVLVGPIATWITAGLDSRHAAGMPLVVSGVGLVIATAGAALIFWAMRSNTFFSAVVRIQSDRGHVVVSTGPYGFVRHPGYVGMSAFMLATPLILASRWAFVPAAVTVALTVVRTALEDRTLQRELPGYVDYARRVRYRLVPWVW